MITSIPSQPPTESGTTKGAEGKATSRGGKDVEGEDESDSDAGSHIDWEKYDVNFEDEGEGGTGGVGAGTGDMTVVQDSEMIPGVPFLGSNATPYERERRDRILKMKKEMVLIGDLARSEVSALAKSAGEELERVEAAGLLPKPKVKLIPKPVPVFRRPSSEEEIRRSARLGRR